MPLSRRAKRRLVLLSSLIVLLVAGGLTARQILTWRQEGILQQTREEGLAAARAGDHAKAISLLGSIFRSMRDDHEVVSTLASSRLAVEQPDGSHLAAAAALFARAAELREDDLESRRQLIEIYPKVGFLREGLDAAEEVLALDDSDFLARSTRIQILASLGRWSEASDECAAMIAKDPAGTEWKRLQLSLALASGATAEEALALCEQWPASSQIDGFDDMLRASLLQASGQRDRAFELVEKAIAAGAADPERLSAMASILSDLGQTDRARAMIEAWISQGPERAQQVSSIASDWAFARSDSRLLDALVEALPSSSTDRGSALVRLLLLELAGEGRRLTELSRRLAESNPVEGSQEARILALVGLRTKFDKALHAAVMTAAVDSDAAVEQLLAGLYAALWVGDLPSALELANRMEATNPTLRGGMMRAELLHRTGQSEAAIAAALAVLRTSPGHPAPLSLIAQIWSDKEGLSASLIEEIRAATGFESPLQCAEAIVEAVGMRPEVDMTLLSAAIDAGRMDVAEDVVVAALAQQPPSIDRLLTIRDRLRELAPPLSASVDDALRLIAAQDPMVAARLAPLTDGELDSMRASLPLEDPSDETRRQAWVTLLVAARNAPAETYVSLATEAIRKCPDEPRLLNLLLAERRSWDSEQLVQELISRLESLVGSDSSTVLVAKSNEILLYRPDDAEARSAMIVALSELVAEQPDSLMVGLSLLRLLATDPETDPQTTIRLGRQILARHPGAVEVYPLVIDLMQSEGMLAESERLLTQFEQIDVAGVTAARQRASQSIREADFDELVLTMTKLSQRSGRADDQYQLGRARESVGDSVGAENAYREALKDPEAPWEAVLRLAAILARRGESAAAESLIVERGKDLSESRRESLLGVLLIESGDTEAGLSRLRRSVEVAPDDGESWRVLANTLSLLGDDDSALQASLQGLKRRPESDDLMRLVVGTSISDPSTITRLEASPELRSMPLILQECIGLLARSVDPETNTLRPDNEDLRLARELCGRRGDSILSWRTALALHSAAGQVAEARSLASAATRAFPDSPEVWEWQVRTLASSGQTEEAIRACREWRRAAFPDVQNVDVAQSVLELGRGRADVALGLLRPHESTIVGMVSDAPGPYRALLGALIMTGSARDAFRFDGQRLTTSSTAREVWARLATLAPYDAGLEAMSLLETASPSDPRGRAIMIGMWLQFHERHPEGVGLDRARGLLGLSANRSEDMSLLAIASADVEKSAGDLDAARRMLDSVITKVSPVAWQRATGLAEIPESERAAVFMEIEPGLYARNNLAMLLVEQGEDLERALRLVDECLAIFPNEPDLRDSRAQVLLAMGRASEAENEVIAALRRQPLNPSFLMTAAEVLTATGRMEDASQTVNRVQDLLSQEPSPSRRMESRLDAIRLRIDG